MPDLFLSVLDLFGDTKWGWIALTVALLSLAFGFLTNIITGGWTGDLTRDELRLLKAFNEQAQGDPRAYLSFGVRGLLQGRGWRVRRQAAG
jgi:hypothetical protein